jgi:hypothetical protein
VSVRVRCTRQGNGFMTRNDLQNQGLQMIMTNRPSASRGIWTRNSDPRKTKTRTAVDMSTWIRRPPVRRRH